MGGDLDGALRDLGAHLAFPPTPDLAAAVRNRLGSAPVPARRRWTLPALRPWARPGDARRALAVAAVLLAVLAGATLVLVPGARTAVADLLGVRGIRIVRESARPTPTASPVGAGLDLGVRLTLDLAQQQVPYPILVPTDGGLGDPDEVYLRLEPEDGMVSLVYRTRPKIPAAKETGVAVLLTQFRGDTERTLIEKGLGGEGVGTGTTLEVVSVDGASGYWIAGDSHSFAFLDANGVIQWESYRLATNVLLWERDHRTFRMEGTMPQETAVRIAAGLVALDEE